jgi:hypothetical protein
MPPSATGLDATRAHADATERTKAVAVGDALELRHGPILPLRVVDFVETGPRYADALAIPIETSGIPRLMTTNGAAGLATNGGW